MLNRIELQYHKRLDNGYELIINNSDFKYVEHQTIIKTIEEQLDNEFQQERFELVEGTGVDARYNLNSWFIRFDEDMLTLLLLRFGSEKKLTFVATSDEEDMLNLFDRVIELQNHRSLIN